MGPFDDEFRRKLLFDENIRRSLAIDDATRRALADSVDVGRRAREMAEQHALMTGASRMGELSTKRKCSKHSPNIDCRLVRTAISEQPLKACGTLKPFGPSWVAVRNCDKPLSGWH